MFIVVEGQHGAGKTYITRLLQKTLSENGIDSIGTCEPTETELGIFARQSEEKYNAETLSCLFAADRMEHCETIKEYIDKGRVVICDRYIYSSMILHNMDGVGFEYILNINKNIIIPDITIILNTRPEVVEDRMKGKKSSRYAQIEMYEKEDLFIQYKDKAEMVTQRLYIFENNTERDAGVIADFALKEVKKKL